jgi:hypothetical protein
LETLLALAGGSTYGSHDLPHVRSRCQSGASSCRPTAVDHPREAAGLEAFVEQHGHERRSGGAGGGRLRVNTLEKVL